MVLSQQLHRGCRRVRRHRTGAFRDRLADRRVDRHQKSLGVGRLSDVLAVVHDRLRDCPGSCGKPSLREPQLSSVAARYGCRKPTEG